MESEVIKCNSLIKHILFRTTNSIFIYKFSMSYAKGVMVIKRFNGRRKFYISVMNIF